MKERIDKEGGEGKQSNKQKSQTGAEMQQADDDDDDEEEEKDEGKKRKK